MSVKLNIRSEIRMVETTPEQAAYMINSPVVKTAASADMQVTLPGKNRAELDAAIKAATHVAVMRAVARTKVCMDASFGETQAEADPAA